MKEHNIKKWNNYDIIWLNSNNLEKDLRCYDVFNLDGVGIDYYNGYELNDIEFLSRNPKIKGVVILDGDKFDLSPIYDLINIEFVAIDQNNKGFDFSKFSNLFSISTSWNKEIVLPQKSRKLKELYLSKYKPHFRSCVELGGFPNLLKLDLVSPLLESLDGLEQLQNLNELSLSYCLKLKDISSIINIPLKSLSLNHCKKINKYHFEKLNSLRKLYVLYCAPIKSLEFLYNMPEIELFSFCGTMLENGDLTPCLKLKRVGFNDNKNYSHRLSEIQKIIKENNY